MKKAKGKLPARVIRITHEATDGAKGFTKHTELKWAQKEAHKWVGEHPEIGSDYAISGDGVVKITVVGATLAELFPPNSDKQVEFIEDAETSVGRVEATDGGVLAQAGGNAESGTGTDATTEDADGDADLGADDKPEPKSVVAPKFKRKYVANARALGVKGKAAKRSNWDWLAQEIAAYCLTSKQKIRMPDFLAILDANGVDHSKWNNRSVGWEGRLRMTGRVALQRIVADANVLKMPGGEELVPPADFVEKYKTKA